MSLIAPETVTSERQVFYTAFVILQRNIKYQPLEILQHKPTLLNIFL